MTREPFIERTFCIEGVDLAYPTHFRDGQSVVGLYAVHSKPAQALIADSGFEVAELWPGKTLLNLVCVHYTDTQCGAYEEIAFAFSVKPPHRALQVPYLSTWWSMLRGTIATFTWCLPVSSVLSQQCGIQMWGFPKTVEHLSHTNEQGLASFEWKRQGKRVLKVSIPSIGDREGGEISPGVYSVIDGQAMVSYLTQSYRGVGYHRNDYRLQLGEDQMSDTLRSLGLPKKPLLASWNGHLKFSMSAPVEL
jgi:hypothetical protein